VKRREKFPHTTFRQEVVIYFSPRESSLVEPKGRG